MSLIQVRSNSFDHCNISIPDGHITPTTADIQRDVKLKRMDAGDCMECKDLHSHTNATKGCDESC